MPGGDWLTSTDSMTERLTALSQQHFGIVTLYEGWQVARDDEALALEQASGSRAWVREVYLCGHGTPWIYARSLTLDAELVEHGLQLASLGNQPLGKRLFAEHGFDRGNIELSRYPQQLLPSDLDCQAPWARRSVFRRPPLAILVTEVFLPALWSRLAIAHGAS